MLTFDSFKPQVEKILGRDWHVSPKTTIPKVSEDGKLEIHLYIQNTIDLKREYNVKYILDYGLGLPIENQINLMIGRIKEYISSEK